MVFFVHKQKKASAKIFRWKKQKFVLQVSDFWKSFFKRIGEGDNLRMIAREYRIPKPTLWDWIQRDQDLMTHYAEAQLSRAMHLVQSME